MRPEEVTLDAIRAARRRLEGIAVRTPLVPLEVERSRTRVWLKLENLQPIGSFKLRGAGNAIALATDDELANGVATASAGNMAQGVAWNARRLGVHCSVLVPDHAPHAKTDAITRLGAEILRVPFRHWWDVIEGRHEPGLAGRFIHPVSDPNVIAGNGTIGLEILEDLPEVDAILVPFGGGGLSSGIATAVRALRPETKVFGCEVETAAPLSASLAAGRPRDVEYEPSFVDGIGGHGLLSEMWPLVSELLDGALVVTLRQVVDALRLMLLRSHVVAEGAGAASVAAALAGAAGSGDVVCVVSGGNIDAAKLVTILEGRVPHVPRH